MKKVSLKQKYLIYHTNCVHAGIDVSENQLKEAKQMVEECDIKYDEVARKLAMVEGDLERAEERAANGESKIVDLEEELRSIGENLKALEVAEEKAQQREEEYKKQVRIIHILKIIFTFLLRVSFILEPRECFIQFPTIPFVFNH